DCHVLLTREPNRDSDLSQEWLPIPGDPNKDPFCAFWEGTDERVLAELCTVLDEAGIPQQTIRREDRLFNRMDQPKLLLGVPASFYQRAEQVVGDAFSAMPLLRDTGGFKPEALEKRLDFDENDPAMELEESPQQDNSEVPRRSEFLIDW